MVLRRSLTTMETDARHLRRKNVKAFQLAIDLSEHDEEKEAATKVKATRHAKEQDCLLYRLSGQMCGSDSDQTYGSTSSSNDDAPRGQ